MTEYFYDCIRVTAGEDIIICAQITDSEGKDIKTGCSLVFIDKDFSIINTYAGTYANGEWTFNIPAEATKEMEGRYWYRIKFHDDSLCFATPIYIGR